MIYLNPLFIFILSFCFNFLRVLQKAGMKEYLYFITEVAYITGKPKDKKMEHSKSLPLFFSKLHLLFFFLKCQYTQENKNPGNFHSFK